MEHLILNLFLLILMGTVVWSMNPTSSHEEPGSNISQKTRKYSSWVLDNVVPADLTNDERIDWIYNTFKETFYKSKERYEKLFSDELKERKETFLKHLRHIVELNERYKDPDDDVKFYMDWYKTFDKDPSQNCKVDDDDPFTGSGSGGPVASMDSDRTTDSNIGREQPVKQHTDRGKPDSFDWRIARPNMIPEIIDQGPSSYCYAIAAVQAIAMHKHLYFKETADPLEILSVKQVVDCTKAEPYSNRGYCGGVVTKVFQYAVDKGIFLSTDYQDKIVSVEAVTSHETQDQDKLSFKSGDVITNVVKLQKRNGWWLGDFGDNKMKQFPSQFVKEIEMDTEDDFIEEQICRAEEILNDGAQPLKIDSYHTLLRNENLMKLALYCRGPMTINVYGSHIDILGYRSDNDTLKHSMLLVGYGTDEQDGDYWSAINFWGDDFGEGGIMRIARGTNMLKITSFVSYPIFRSQRNRHHHCEQWEMDLIDNIKPPLIQRPPKLILR